MSRYNYLKFKLASIIRIALDKWKIIIKSNFLRSNNDNNDNTFLITNILVKNLWNNR